MKRERERFTPRLTLVPIGPRSTDAVLALHRDEAVARYWGRWTRNDAERFAAAAGTGWDTHGVHKWLAYERTTGLLVGRGGLSRQEVDGSECLEVGWTLRGRFRGHGYATEIGRAGLSFAFDELGAERVVSFTEIDNTPSRAVMERLGMRYSHDMVLGGGPFALYVLTRADDRA